MMQAIRDRAGGLVSMAIIAFICIVLVATGGFDYFVTTPDDAAASVNGEDIAVGDFQTAFSRYRQQMQQQFGNFFDRNYFDQPLIRRQFLDQMIASEVAKQAASDAGLTITPERLRREIQNLDVFRVDGEFNRDLYARLLAQQNLTPTRFEADFAEDLLVRELDSAINATALALPGEIARLEQLQRQQRSFEYVAFSASDFVDQVTVTDEEIAQHYEDNESKYMAPEQVVISYVELVADDAAGDFEVSESTLMQRYEEQKMRFEIPERRLTSHILIELSETATPEEEQAALEQARSLAERARNGESFADLAMEFSDDTGSADLGGDLDWVEPEVMVKPFEDALFALEEGAISDPVRSSFGYHVIWAREIEPRRGKTFEEAREELAAEYREAEAERLFLEQQDLLYDLSYEDQGSLATAASALDLEVKTVGPFPRTGGEGIAADPQVIEAAFSDQVLLEQVNSDPINLAADRVVVVRINEHIESRLKTLEEVADEVRAALVEERARALAREAAEALKQQLADGTESLAEIAAAQELEAQSVSQVPRNGRPAEVDMGLVQGVFRMPRPEEGSQLAVVPFGQDQFAVVALTEVSVGPPSESLASSLETRQVRATAGAETTALDEALRESADITVLEDRINP